VLGVNAAFIASERWATSEASFSKTANRSELGVMNRLELELDYVGDRVGDDMLELSLYMPDHLVGPLRGTEIGTPQERLNDVVHAQARQLRPTPGTGVCTRRQTCPSDRTRDVPSEPGDRSKFDDVRGPLGTAFKPYRHHRNSS
jgi:hypothetical protein